MSSRVEQSSAEARDSALTQSFFYRLGWIIAGHKWQVVGLWVLLVVVGGLLSSAFENSMTIAGMDVNNSESARVAEMLQTRFTQQYPEQDMLVFESKKLLVNDAAYKQVINNAVEQMANQKGVGVVISPLSVEAQNQVSTDKHAAFAIMGVSGNDDERLNLVPKLNAVAQKVTTSEVEVYVTGYSPMAAALVEQETQDLEQAEIFGLPIALVVLLIAFGSVVAAVLPVGLALVGMVFAFGILGVITLVTNNGFNLFLEEASTMIGLGVGIDYTLFNVTRFREELAAGSDIRNAIAVMSARAGKTVFFSGGTVLVALSGLLLVNSKIFSDLAIGAMFVVGAVMLVVLILLPAILAILGTHINSGTLRFLQQDLSKKKIEHGFWARWAQAVMRHPFLWIAVVSVILLAATTPIFDLHMGIDYGTSSLGDRPAGNGFRILGQYFSKGALSPTQILVESQHGPLTDADLNAVARLTADLQKDSAVDQVSSITSVLDKYAGSHSEAVLRVAANLPQDAQYLGYYVNLKNGSNLAMIMVIPKVAIDSPAAYELIDRIRNQYVPKIEAASNVKILVGGLSAETVDLNREVSDKLPWVITLVLALSFVLLLIAFRSIFLPIKAILMNLLSIGTSYGLLVLFFQLGWGENIFGFTSPGIIQVFLPLLTFAVLFGLSMDYEVFLIGRMKEEWRRSSDNDEAVASGIEHTACIITSAAAIMVAVFGAFTFTTVLEAKEMGFSMSVAVLFDATLIRLLLVPAAMKVMGHWNWWFPGWLSNALPAFDL